MTQSESSPVPKAVMRFWNRLAFRFGIGLAVAGALTLAGSAWLNLHLQQDHTMGLMQSRADELVGVVMSVTRDAMLANDKGELEHLIGAIGSQHDIRRIRLIDPSGRIQYSDVGDDVGSILGPGAPSCVACHAQTPPVEDSPPMDRVRVLDPPPGGDRILEVFAAVPNQPQCSDAVCHAHPAEQQVLGVLEARLSLAAMQTDLASSSRELAGALFLGVLVIVLIVGAFTWRWVLQPVGELTVASDRLAAGDLGVRVPVRTRDEMGALGTAWNHMADELAAARADLQEWGATLEERVDQKTTELRQAQEQMLRVERMASLGALAAEVAHEINNPLAGIAMYARLMRRKLGYDNGASTRDDADPVGTHAKPLDTDELANVLAMIDDESRRCGKIVRNLLLFSSTPTAQVTEVDLGAVLERCCMLVGHKAELDDIAIDTEINPGTPAIQGDPAQIEQMLLGLVMNAIEACAAGDTVTIAVAPGREPGGVRLSVRDTGRGIPADHRDKIFEPFFSTKTESSGIGLGLSVVYGIVQRHGGTIEVRSAEGIGTEMLIELPAHPPGDLEEEGPTPADQVFKQRNSPARPPDEEEP